jgi:hypothetical protein
MRQITITNYGLSSSEDDVRRWFGEMMRDVTDEQIERDRNQTKRKVTMNPRLKSKTNLTAIAIAVLGVVETNAPMLRDLLGEWYGLTYVGIGVAMVILREVTKTPVTEK